MSNHRRDRQNRYVSALAAAVVLVSAVMAADPAPTPAANQGATAGAAPAPATPAPASKVYPPAGGPANPKVDARWNRYYDFQQATELLQQIAAAHPDLCQLESLGRSYGGREMWVMTITRFSNDRRPAALEAKAAMWIDGGIHANEVQATEVVLYTAWYLTEMAIQNPFISRLLDQRVFYLMPMMSPDSRDAHFHKANTTHSPRTGQRPVDDDRDGLVDEDGPDDLNGDSQITQMRLADPHGDYRPDDKLPELMIAIPPGDEYRGPRYRLLGTEGIDNDRDGRVNEDGDGSYDPNRDWGWNWQPGHIQGGAHRYPFSLLENRMVADFIAARPHIAGGQSYHNTGGMILRSPGVEGDPIHGDDARLLEQLSKEGERMLPGYAALIAYKDLYTVYGGCFDWLYQSRGIIAFTNELHTPFNLFRHKDGDSFFAAEKLNREFDKLLLFGEAFVPWTAVEHPQYGKVEVGGLKKSFGRQPPSFMLEDECHRNMAFTLYHADQMPLLRLAEVKVRPVAAGISEVTVTIANDRLIPSRTGSDLAHKITRPDRLTVAGTDLKVLAGLTADEPFFERPTVQRRDLGTLDLPAVPGAGVVYARWLVQGQGNIRVQLDSVKGGRATASATLAGK